ncbi:MAG: permease prefix domain 1-containing protein, partial [Blastocatellia bacterium]
MKFPWNRKQREAELDSEIRSHLDEAIRDRIECGESPDDARANALREFGNVGLVKEVTREIWGWASLERLGQDLRFGWRMLWKNPG